MAHYTNAEKADILHQASLLYMASNIPIDYGTGEKYTPVEVHALKYVLDHPGKTTTDLSHDWDKTKASVSQLMKKLEEKGLVERHADPASRRKQLYFGTAIGCILNECHRRYDEETFGSTLSPLYEKYTDQQLDFCFEVLAAYCDARRRKHYRAE